MAPAVAACFTGLTVAGNTASLLQNLLDVVDKIKRMFRREEDIEVECPECDEPVKKKDLKKHLKKHSKEDADRIKTESLAELEVKLQRFREEMELKREKDRAKTKAALRDIMESDCPYCFEPIPTRELRSHIDNVHWKTRDAAHVDEEGKGGNRRKEQKLKLH